MAIFADSSERRGEAEAAHREDEAEDMMEAAESWDAGKGEG